MLPEDVDATIEVGRVTAALRTAIRLSGVSHRHIERELRLSTGYLTRILAGQVQLRVAHVLSVCRVIGMPPGSFFAALFPPSQTRARRDPFRMIQELRDCVDELKTLLKVSQEPQA